MITQEDVPGEGQRAPTFGEYKVGIAFNPGNNPKVDELKRKAADFIDAVEAISQGTPDNPMPDHQYREVGRLKALAITHAEDAAMWAVKAATKPV